MIAQEVGVSPVVAEFLSRRPVGHFIGGKWVISKSGKTFETRDPGTGEVLAEVAAGGEAEVDAAVGAARRAFENSGWAAMAPNERAVYLHRLADLVEARKETIAEIESLDVGKPLAQARGDVGNFSQTIRYFADMSVQVRYREPIAVSKHEARTVRLPRGVCGFIIPWNFPFLLAGWSLGPSLAAGNTVVIKPAEDTPLSTLFLMTLIQEAGIPDGVVNVVAGIGEVAGAAVARHPGFAHMSFTGSPEVGRIVARECGQNLVPVKLELGGKGAAVLFPDVDVESSAEALVSAITLNSGQVCCTASRWIVHEKIYDQFVSAAVDRMGRIRIGYGRDDGTQMGPVVSEKQRKRVLGYLEKGRAEGASLILPGGRAQVDGHENGFYVKPAMMTGDPNNVACREEIFGPVPYLMKFREEKEAVDLVNRSHYGLANSVWSADLARADRVAERMVAGNSWINAHNVFPHGVPYGGVNLSGMGGGVNSPATFFDYLRELSVVRPTG